MPGLVPGIHVLFDETSCLIEKIVDGRDKPGHDEKKREKGDKNA
jgi:hypothetical protein